ncbi:MAG: phosphatidate cytidylyltransferase [Chloroflexota bacterium]|nr:phosphatidate cytidylyltransferase [Chloroflexota bacterium]
MASEPMAARSPRGARAERVLRAPRGVPRGVVHPAVAAPPAATGERPGALAKRVVSAIAVATPVVVGAYLGGPWFLLGTGLLGYLGLREFYALSERPGARLVQPLGFLLGCALLLANGGRDLLWRGLVDSAGDAPAWLPAGNALAAVLRPDGVGLLTQFVVAMAVVLPLVALLFERRDPQGRLVGWALTLAGTLYVAWLLSHFQTLRLVGAPGDEAGRGWVFYVFAGTWSYDTGAYLVGRRFGRHRFMTWISPKKTWEGAAGGLAFCLLATLIARSAVPSLVAPIAQLTGWAPLPIPLWHVPGLALALCVVAQLGDLAESMIKREAGAKDASDLIPGHGGMLDRMDSLLFTVVLVYYYVRVIALP